MGVETGRRGFIPYAKQWIEEDDIAAVAEALTRELLTTGDGVPAFERALCDAVGAEHAVAVCNGTAALHAACYAAGVRAGDEVVTSPMTFAASANCALYLGAKPVFCDVDEHTWNIDPAKLDALVTKRTRALLPVHYTGQPCEMDKIMAVARAHGGLAVVEDAAHALGATYKGAPVGAIGDFTCFSFHPVKHVTTGEGGAVTTRDADAARMLQMFRTHGITRDIEHGITRDIQAPSNPEPDSDGHLDFSEYRGEPWYYEQRFLGYNYRLTDVMAALGVSQMRKLPRFLARRRAIAARYMQGFAGLAAQGRITLPLVAEGADPAWHLFVVRVPPAARPAFIRALRAQGVGTNLHYIPVYLHPYYRSLGYAPGLCPVAERLYASIVTLPMYPKMDDGDVDYVIDCVCRELSRL